VLSSVTHERVGNNYEEWEGVVADVGKAPVAIFRTRERHSGTKRI
jgi:hypothetical protein